MALCAHNRRKAVLIDPRAFFVNEILFPLGLTKIKSPAESPLLGQKLVGLFGSQLHLFVVAALVLIGAELALVFYRRMRPASLAAMTGYVALIFFIAILLAPATRFGYLLYPANMAVWAIILHKADQKLRTSSQVQVSTVSSVQSPSV